ncbi:hypothetical protein QJS66_02720 [Kocuria rhizophila]|nr:hypothetical protein QJS66_02720 [Kocuria rhizophila]
MNHVRPLTTVVLPLTLLLVTVAWTGGGTVSREWAYPAPPAGGDPVPAPVVRRFRFADLSAVRA